MDERLKRRLVGAVVLVSLGVIFIPMLLEGPPGSGAHQRVAEIPPPPAREFISRIVPLGKVLKADGHAAPKKPPATLESKVAPGRKGDAESSAVSKSRQRLGISAWAVQLGSFASEANAMVLRDRLRKKGYAAFSESVPANEGTVTRVYVGPELLQKNAEKIQRKLEAEFKLEGIVRRYPG